MRRHRFQTLHFVESPEKRGSYTEVMLDLPEGYELPTHFHLTVTLVRASNNKNVLSDIEVWRVGQAKEIK